MILLFWSFNFVSCLENGHLTDKDVMFCCTPKYLIDASHRDQIYTAFGSYHAGVLCLWHAWCRGQALMFLTSRVRVRVSVLTPVLTCKVSLPSSGVSDQRSRGLSLGIDTCLDMQGVVAKLWCFWLTMSGFGSQFWHLSWHARCRGQALTFPPFFWWWLLNAKQKDHLN